MYSYKLIYYDIFIYAALTLCIMLFRINFNKVFLKWDSNYNVVNIDGNRKRSSIVSSRLYSKLICNNINDQDYHIGKWIIIIRDSSY